ncbi:MAG TPA: ThiF family adenylyltransferase [Candidatus Binatia bacterium]|jgi:adenylyltransferase/sulfurtransferase|nr:ThiF family adenylyltransferase [Candidatus Binatia bacterium]
MLAEAQIERYARQILLPEVGGRGQARWLAARVALLGTGDAAVVAATLLGRAGVGTLALADGPLALPELGPDCRVAVGPGADADVTVALGAAVSALDPRRPVVHGTAAGTRLRIATLVGRPCAACAEAGAASDGPPPPPAALALGALAASEALRVLLAAPDTGRLQTLDLATGELTGTPLVAPGCARCGTRA